MCLTYNHNHSINRRVHRELPSTNDKENINNAHSTIDPQAIKSNWNGIVWEPGRGKESAKVGRRTSRREAAAAPEFKFGPQLRVC